MITAYLALKIGVLLMTLVLPLGRRRPGSKHNIELSDWVVNQKGELVDLSETEARNHPIRIKH